MATPNTGPSRPAAGGLLLAACVITSLGLAAPAWAQDRSAEGVRAAGPVRMTTKQGSRVPTRVVRMPMAIVRMPMSIVRMPMGGASGAPSAIRMPENIARRPEDVPRGERQAMDRASGRDTACSRSERTGAGRRVSTSDVSVFRNVSREALFKLSDCERLRRFKLAQDRALAMESARVRSMRHDGGASITDPGPQDRDPALDLHAEHLARQQAIEASQRPPEDLLERARWHARESRWLDAAATLGLHLETNPEDADAARDLAALLLIETRAADGGAMLIEAYRADPTLAQRPIDLTGLGLDRRASADLWNAARDRAANRPSAGSLLAAGVVAQAMGNTGPAARFIDRAAQHGLDPLVAAAFEASIPERPESTRASRP